jgi:hypothetical protein
LTEVRAQGRGTRKMRTVFEGDGWWQGEAGAKDILDPLDGDRLIGSRRSFSFMREDCRRCGSPPWVAYGRILSASV